MYSKTYTRKAMLLLLAGVPAATVTYAQRPRGGRGQGGPGGRGGGMNLERLQKELDLTEEQMEKLGPVFKENTEKNAALREKFMNMERSQENMQAMREEREKNAEALNGKMAEVLNEDQMKKWEDLQQKMRGPGRGGPGGGRRGGGRQQ
jgi:Spy/CpxP family protein refolding chaperone